MDERIEEFIRRERVKKSDGTARRRRTDLRSFTKWLDEAERGDLTDLTPRDIEDYLLHLVENGYSESTVRGRYVSVDLLYQELAESRRLMESNPAEPVDVKEFVANLPSTRKEEALREDIHYLTPEEKEALCENVADPTLRNELVIRLGWQTGLRQKELAGIRLDDLNRDDRSIRVQSAKTGEIRTVYYQPSLDLLMNQWLDGGYRSSSPHASESPYLFLSFCSEQMNAKRVNKIVKDAAEGAGLQEPMYEDAGGQTRWKITGHTLRHSFAVQSLKNGMDVRTLSKVMGHKELETTKKYLRITDDDAKEMLMRYGAGTEELS